MDRFAHSSDEIRVDETADSSASIRIDDRNYNLSFTAGDARWFARFFGSKWDVKFRFGVNIVNRYRERHLLSRGANEIVATHTRIFVIPRNRTIVPAHSSLRILFRQRVGYAAYERIGSGRESARTWYSAREDRRHRKFCRVMQELLSNAADRRDEGKEKERKGGRKWSLSVRAKYEKWSVDVPVAVEKANAGFKEAVELKKPEGRAIRCTVIGRIPRRA